MEEGEIEGGGRGGGGERDGGILLLPALMIILSCSGGTEYIVTGQNLNIVQNPKLLISVRSSVGGRQTRQAMEEDMEMWFESEVRKRGAMYLRI